MENSSTIWMDGKLIPWNQANVHVMTHTLHYGFGVFEGIRCYKTPKGPAVFRLQDHMERLYKSAHIMQIKIPFSLEDAISAVKETITANKFESCYIRPIVFLGDNKRGLNPNGANVHFAIATWQWGSYLGDEGVAKGIRVKISSYSRHHMNITMTKSKSCGNYVNSIMAKLEAVNNGYDEAILLDTHGNVAEGTGENIFISRRGALKTPPINSILEGLTRDTVIKIASDNGIPVIEQNFSRDELYISDDAFFCGTAAEITPIREVDKRQIGKGEPGEITKKIQSIYFNTVTGKEARYEKWLDYL